jgi:hypothetical protein
MAIAYAIVMVNVVSVVIRSPLQCRRIWDCHGIHFLRGHGTVVVVVVVVVSSLPTYKDYNKTVMISLLPR